jgi:fructose-1,6-bisphosphatase/inositol monophosphatase family enzyme
MLNVWMTSCKSCTDGSDPLRKRLARNPPFGSQRNYGASALEWCYVAAVAAASWHVAERKSHRRLPTAVAEGL